MNSGDHVQPLSGDSVEELKRRSDIRSQHRSSSEGANSIVRIVQLNPGSPGETRPASFSWPSSFPAVNISTADPPSPSLFKVVHLISP